MTRVTSLESEVGGGDAAMLTPAEASILTPAEAEAGAEGAVFVRVEVDIVGGAPDLNAEVAVV